MANSCDVESRRKSSSSRQSEEHREPREDVFAEKNGKTIRGFTRDAREALLRYDYPGNVRELENLIERAVVLTRDDVIGRGDLPLSLEESGGIDDKPAHLIAAVEGLERRMIKEDLTRTGGIQTRAAELLGITERALRYKLRKYGLQSEEPDQSRDTEM
jgi:DNA-binding NtrC family response regulator